MPRHAWIASLTIAIAAAPTRAQDAGGEVAGPAEAPAAQAPPAEGPIVEVPEEFEVPPPEPASAETYLRGMQEQRFREARNTSIGGYGELHFHAELPEGGSEEIEIDLHRLVLFVAHQFDASFRFYTEIEVEHALAFGSSEVGSVGIEQAFVDWRVLGDPLWIRAGVVLVPMGIVNQWHEPPIFHGVDRPRVDRVVVPTTWREGGIGIAGRPLDWLRYELYVIGGLDAAGFRASSGIRSGRQNVAEAFAGSPALTGRLEVEPSLGIVAGLSGYFGLAGRATLGIDAPIAGVSADFRTRLEGLEARAMLAYFAIGDTERMRAMTDPAGNSLGIDIGSGVLGTYAEIGYDLLHAFDLDHSLVPFVRGEWIDTTLADRDAAYDEPAVASVVAGLTYRPIPQLAIKADAVFRRPEQGPGEDIYSLGVGWMH